MANLARDWMTVNERRWENELPAGTPAIRLKLLHLDLHSLKIAFVDYLGAERLVNARVANPSDAGISSWPDGAWARMFHHAKVFVVCMRRFGRLLDAARRQRHEYPQEVGDAIDLACRKTKAFFGDYHEARNAIEHIDGEVNGHNRRFLNLWADQLEVVAGKSAHVTRPALATVEQAWATITDAILSPAEMRVRVALRELILRMLHARLEYLARLTSGWSGPAAPAAQPGRRKAVE